MLWRRQSADLPECWRSPDVLIAISAVREA
jgi:hypothetical protein